MCMWEEERSLWWVCVEENAISSRNCLRCIERNSERKRDGMCVWIWFFVYVQNGRCVPSSKSRRNGDRIQCFTFYLRISSLTHHTINCIEGNFIEFFYLQVFLPLFCPRFSFIFFRITFSFIYSNFFLFRL